MPRKTSRAAKKEAAVDSKEEGVAPRRSGRSVTKSEPSTGKDASRSRRSSTAAQTAASVADSKSPKGRSSATSRRESTSPSDSRTRGGREGLESPATRVKSTRRSTGRVNYKESDGEEEVPTPKYDENFDSGDEFDESESDEKSKPRGKSKPVRTAAKGRGSKEKTEGRTRGRRGRPSKKRAEDEEESKTFDVSDDSMELEVVATKEANTSNKEKDVSRSRGRRQKVEVVEEKTDNKPKSSRRSVRSISSKDESPRKRPSRSVQAKRYTEDEEDDIEDIKDDIEEEKEEKTETEGLRKRKRESSPGETNKRIKESESQQKDELDKESEDELDKESEDELDKESEEVKEEVKELNIAAEKCAEDKTVEEPMELDECDSGIVSQDDSKAQEEEEISDVIEDKKETVVEEQKSETSSPLKDKTEESDEPVKEKLEDMPDTDNTLVNKVEQATSSEAEDIKHSKEPAKEDTSDQKFKVEEVSKQNIIVIPSQPSNDAQAVDPTLEDTKNLSSEIRSESEKISHSPEKIKESNNSETHANDVSQESKLAPEIPTTLSTPTESSTIHTTNSNSEEVKPDHTLNGTENINKIESPISAPQVSEVNVGNKENSVSKENGAHEDVHTNSTTLVDQYCLLPGRKYKVNSKLKEGILQSVKGQTFGFLSYNLGSDMSVQKEKLLNELHKLNSHIICLQQVPKPFYSAVLEPSLDALGYKSVFCQPEDSLKGMATFYKNSLFRLSSHSDVSLKRLIDKELETSSLDQASKFAVKSHIKRCGCVLFTNFASVIGTQTITVVNVQIPPSDLNTHALQVSCLAREIIRINGGTNKPLLIGGEFNILENDASYQLLRDGYLSNDKIDELQRRKDIAVPEKENSSLVDLLWKSFQHPSSNLCSCYNSVLDHELFIPELKATSPDLVWYSSGSLHTIGVLDVGFDKLNDHHISLKADIAFAI